MLIKQIEKFFLKYHICHIVLYIDDEKRTKCLRETTCKLQIFFFQFSKILSSLTIVGILYNYNKILIGETTRVIIK